MPNLFLVSEIVGQAHRGRGKRWSANVGEKNLSQVSLTFQEGHYQQSDFKNFFIK